MLLRTARLSLDLFLRATVQELLAYLLDGIHEDLNLVVQKPYVEAPEGDDSSDDDRLAQAAWEAHLKRNRSIVVDLFQVRPMVVGVCWRAHINHWCCTGRGNTSLAWSVSTVTMCL